MPQKTNLNVSPYYDDFDKDDNFYKVLFKPGFPVQARELTGLQSILQNQIESFGSHMFKEGSMVIPGGITCDNVFTTIKVNPTHLGIDVTIYLDALTSGKGTRVKGQTSGATGRVRGYLLPPDEGVEEITLFIKYKDGGLDGESTEFTDGEILILEENITYGNTTLVSGDTVLTLTGSNSAAIGYAVGVSPGVYFIRGTFVDVPESLIVLDPYNNEPSFRVGWDIVEEIVTADKDESLNDNAKGFTNYAAPGADRLKISVKLAKKQLTDTEDTNFVELVRVDEGVIKKLQNKAQYNLIRDYFAKRTFDESGDYAVENFIVDTADQLNDETGNGGLFRFDEVTDQGNIPSKDQIAVKVSAGTAYVRGYDVDLVGSTILDVPKPRTTKTIKSSVVPFSMGGKLKVNNVTGTPFINIGDLSSGTNNTSSNTIELYAARRNHSGINNITNAATAGLGTKIGDARVYWFGLSDDTYKNVATEFDLYLFDIQTYTEVTLANTYSLTDVPVGSYFRGLSSGATGYLATSSSNTYSLRQTSGKFMTGEQVIINEDVEFQSGITALDVFTTDDIKAVFQDVATKNGVAGTPNFIADTVLYPVELPNFAKTDMITIPSAGTSTKSGCTVAGRFFAGQTGIVARGSQRGRTIKYQNGNADPVYANIDSINADGTEIDITINAQAVAGVYRNVNAAGKYTFSIMAPKITNFGSTGLYAPMPIANTASVDLGRADLTITRQIVTSFSGSQISLTLTDAVEATEGLTNVFYESFDAERYSIYYSDGSVEPLTDSNFILGANGESITLNGLTKTNDTNTIVNVTLSKRVISHKTKNFLRSEQVTIDKTQKKSALNGLTANKFYGLRIEDNDISLNVPDVVNVRAILESTDSNAPVLDKLTFATGLALDQNAIVGEKITGRDSRAVAQVVGRTATTITYVRRNSNNFVAGETVTFGDSAIEAIVQKTTKGSYVDLTANYRLVDGNGHEYCDFSKIQRRPGSPTPDKQLLVIFDRYDAASGDEGDFFTVNSYSADRYQSDLPTLPNGLSVSDLVDFRPRVKPFTSTTASPFDFSSRQYDATYTYVISPDETSHVGYSYYLPRIDTISINRFGEVEVIQGEPDDVPQSPVLADDAMEIAQIQYPAFCYNAVKDPRILFRDNRRFTMRDIGKLEDRIENLEELTSLTMLELNAKTLSVTDANGLDRFKSGFIVSDFRDKSLMNPDLSTVEISKEGATAIAPIDFWSINADLGLDPNIDRTTADLSQNLRLLDTNIQKTGDMLTLKYDEVEFLNQPHATNVENVNPFNVIVFVGGVQLDPPSDNWVRTIYIDDHRTEQTGAQWKQEANTTRDVDKKTEYVTYKKGGGRGERKTRAFTTTTITTTTKFTPKLKGPAREFNYVEDVKVSGEADPWMRSRNVYFNADGLRPYTKHYKYLDSQQVDVIPKVCEIQMRSGTFQVFEDADIYDANNNKIGMIRIQAPNHKFGDTSRPDIGAGLGSPATLVETYSVDPYDRDRPAPGAGYSPTSRLINFGVRSLANVEKYYGYVEKGAKVVGRSSSAEATITRAELISDNWGDIVGNFFFRDPNSKPRPATRVKAGTKTVKVTATPPNTVVLPGSTRFASEAIGEYSGSGTILTQETSRVSVRNPPKPAAKPTEVQVEVKAPHRDPLAQSFTVPGKGIFFTSFDLYFAAKPTGTTKVKIELRTMELGIPTDRLVADWCRVNLRPEDIQINEADPFNPIPTRVRFPSPVFLEGGDKEYAIVVLSPDSDEYEMWTATMGKKTVRTTSLPDVQNVVVTKQYIGGSLFKSQNGTIWTPSQFQDLTFKIYKAQFVKSGTLTWYNSDIGSSRGSDNSHTLNTNPIESLPRKLKLPINTGGNATTAATTVGTKIGEGSNDGGITGFIENIGAPAATITLDVAGSGYANGTHTTCNLTSLTGKGTGGQVTLTVADGVVTGATLTNNGSGYVAGEQVEIDTSTIGSTAAVRKGKGAKLTITTIGTVDTLYLNDVQGENFTDTTQLFTIAANGTRTSAGSNVTVNGGSSLIDNRFSGNVFRVKQQTHAHHGGNNKVKIEDIQPDTKRTQLTATFGLTDTNVSVADTTVFTTFEGITTSRGYALVNNEIIRFTDVNETSAPAGTLTISNRNLDGTIKIEHGIDSSIQPYEVNGVSLTRINRTHDVPSTSYTLDESDIDFYYLEVDRSLESPTIRDSGANQLSFTSEKGFGGDTVGISQNCQFSSLVPQFNVITPGLGTKITCNVRTISGTSSGGTEVSFLDQGYESVTLNKPHQFSTPRMVASKVNEEARLGTLPSKKSLTLRVDFASDNQDLSPMMDAANATFILGRNKANNPVSDYSTDHRSNEIIGDPHGAVFVTKSVSLAQPATSLKVIIAANRQEDADFRVFYQLFKADSTEVDQKFIPFPGYDNLLDTDGDGFGDRVKDPDKNSGRADAFVTPNQNTENSFSEYQFSADNLEQFTAFSIKVVMSTTNESTPVKLRDFRAIALA